MRVIYNPPKCPKSPNFVVRVDKQFHSGAWILGKCHQSNQVGQLCFELRWTCDEAS